MGRGYSSDDEEFPLGDATDVNFTLDDLDADARRRRAILRAEALAAGQKIPVGAAGYTGTSAEDRDPEADLDAAGSIRDLLVPQSPLDFGLMAAMGPGSVPVKAGLGALGMALESSDAEAALGPGMARRFFSPLVELIRNLDVKKPLPPEAWRQLLEPDPKTGKQARFRDARTGLEHPVTPDEWEFAQGDAILKDLGDPKRFKSGRPEITKDELADLIEAEYPGLETRELGHSSNRLTETQLQRYRDLDHRAVMAQQPSWTIVDTRGNPVPNRRFYSEDLAEDALEGMRQSGQPFADRYSIMRVEAPQLTTDELAEVERLRPLYESGEHLTHTPQYSQYTLKGPRTEGSYQESLTKYERLTPGLSEAERRELVDLSNQRERVLRDAPNDRNFDAWYDTPEGVRYIELNERATKAHHGENDEAFVPRAAHFNSEPNLLAHSRADRRTTVDGLKARHVDELQSDWHQQARDEGGYNQPLTKNELDELQELRMARKNIGRRSNNSNPRVVEEWIRSPAGQRYLELDRRAEAQENRPPSAPLRKNWHEVELKKQLAQAIEDGDDLLTWTTGEQQIERYKRALRQQVDRIDWVRRPDGKYDITPMKGGRPVNSSSARSKLEGLTDRELEDTIGTEMAKKIRESKGTEVPPDTPPGGSRVTRVTGTLTGDDLTVGGAGMRSFYDREVVETAKKLAKRYGGEYVKTELPGPARTGGDVYNWQLPQSTNPMFSAIRRTGTDAVAEQSKWVFETIDDSLTELIKRYERDTSLAMRADDLVDYSMDLSRARTAVREGEMDSGEFSMFMHDLHRFLTNEEREFIRGQIDKKLGQGALQNHAVHAIKITPQMREKLKATGGKFSLYADGGAVPELPWEEREGFAGGGDIMRALLRRLGLTRETPVMRKMGEEELVRPFAGEASSERQVIDELENPARRELLFGRARPEMRTEAESTRNLPALYEESELPAVADDAAQLSSLEQAARYEPSRRHFMQGAASLATLPKRLELLSETVPELVEVAKPKLVVPSRSKILEAASDWLKDYYVKYDAGELMDDVDDVGENLLAAVAKKTGADVEAVKKVVRDPYQFTDAFNLAHEPPVGWGSSDALLDSIAENTAEITTKSAARKAAVETAAEHAGLSRREYTRLYKRMTGRSAYKDADYTLPDDFQGDFDDGGAVPELPWEEREGMAGGGEVMRALLRRLGLASETPVMRRMSEEELVRPFAGDAGSERQVVDELENPSRRELLFGRVRPEMRTEAESTRNLPALYEEPRLPATLSDGPVGALEQAARYEPSRRVFMQGAASLATLPKRLELLSETVPELVEAAKPKLVVPRKNVIDTLGDILHEQLTEINKRGGLDYDHPDLPNNVWVKPELLEDIDVVVAKRLNVPVEEVHKHFDAPTLHYYSMTLADPVETISSMAHDGTITSVKQTLKELADMADLKPKEYKQLMKRLHNVDVETEIREAMDDYRDGGYVARRTA